MILLSSSEIEYSVLNFLLRPSTFKAYICAMTSAYSCLMTFIISYYFYHVKLNAKLRSDTSEICSCSMTYSHFSEICV